MGRKILFRLEKEEDGTLKFTEGYAVEVLTLKPPQIPTVKPDVDKGCQDGKFRKSFEFKGF